MKTKYILIYLILFFSFPVLSQTTISLPYFCGFEESSENSNWMLNTGPNGLTSQNKWYISNATSNLGINSLYISADGGATPGYAGAQTAIVAYREFVLPAGNNTYRLSFSWRAMGDANAKLHVCWMPAGANTESSAMGLPSWVSPNSLTTALNVKSGWQHITIPIPSSSGNYKLVFVWENANSTPFNPGACIDNIQINKNSGCPPPTGLSYTKSGTSVTLSWSGSTSSYDVMYTTLSDPATVRTIYGVSSNTTTLNNLQDGLYTFWVRSNCDTENSVWVPVSDIVVYDPAAHCLDYINFSAPGVSGTLGTFGNPTASAGVLDRGETNDSSRQTVNYIQDAYDPRTDGRLRTIPYGELFSVRLGNWRNNTEAETLTYTLAVPSTDPGILILNYAVVAESGGHDPDIQPRFDLKIFNAAGKLIDPTCGTADFRPPKDENYTVAGDGWIQGIADKSVWWRDWTPIGINLLPYAGQTIRIQLTNYDCAWGGHWGYSYFTLNCASATITSNSCGESDKLSVTAPDGFNYRWYSPQDPTVTLGTDKNYEVVNTSDTATFYCDVIYKSASQCRFTLKTVLQPRYPFARAGYFYDPQNCENRVRLSNTSGVKGINDVETGEEVESNYWAISDGRTSYEKTPTFVFPDSGGTYQVSLKVGIVGDRCTDSIGFTMVIPPIQETNDTIHRTICDGNTFMFNGIPRNKTGLYPAYLKSRAGCDSIVVLDLKVVDKIVVSVYDTICAGETYPNPNGGSFGRSGTYMYTILSYAGCDSTTTLYLTVQDEVTFTATAQDALTGPNSGSINLSIPSGYTYDIDGVSGGDLTGLAAGTYEITVYNERGCASKPQQIVVSTTCLSISEVLPVGVICGDESDFAIEFEILEGSLTNYSVYFDEKAVAAGFDSIVNASVSGTSISIPLPLNVRPDNYTLRLELNDLNCTSNDLNFDIDFTIYYPSAIVEQKWNDVFAVLNEKYNGNYVFSAFQWYKNGEPIHGATGSYYYLQNNIFNSNDMYQVGLTRIGDSISVLSCPIIPVVKTETNVYPTVVAPGGVVIIKSKSNSNTTIRLWDTMGQIRKTTATKDDLYQMTMPNMSGVYLIELLSDEGNRETYHIIVR